MGQIKDRADSVYRDFKLDGVLSSGLHEPTKRAIREVFRVIDIAVATAQAGLATVADLTARDAFYAEAANQGKLVYVNNNNGLPDDPANGVYEYVDGAARIAEGFNQGVAAAVQSIIDDAVEDVLRDGDLTLLLSPNLARAEFLLDGKYVSSTGAIVVAPGWKTYRIPVTPGTDYSFGNFVIDVAGYSAFYDAEGETAGDMVAYNGSHTNASLPKTFTAPVGAAWLYITVARPTNSPEDWAQTMINEGAALLPYEPPVDTVTAIAGKRVAGDVDTDAFARLGEDANFDALTASSLATSAIVANLPSGAARPAEVDINEVWIDTSAGGTDAPLKVRLS